MNKDILKRLERLDEVVKPKRYKYVLFVEKDLTDEEYAELRANGTIDKHTVIFIDDVPLED